jgi:hypothetical protein
MDTSQNNIFIGPAVSGSSELDIVPLPRLRAATNVPVDHCFFETKGFPQSALDNYSDLQPTLFSHPYLYSLSWGHKVIRFFCKSNTQQS